MDVDLNQLPVGCVVHYPEQTSIMVYLGDGFWADLDGPCFTIIHDPEFVPLVVEDIEYEYCKEL